VLFFKFLKSKKLKTTPSKELLGSFTTVFQALI